MLVAMPVRPPKSTLLTLLLAFSMLGTAHCAPPKDTMDQRELVAPLHSVRVVSTLPHDPEAFTQGLFVHEGVMYESTGQYGSSSVRMVDMNTGKVLRRRAVNDAFFGEGLARVGTAAVQLTWKAGVGLAYDLHTLEPLKTFSYRGEGWGLASGPGSNAGPVLVMSDGSDELVFLNPSTLKPESRLQVRDGSHAVNRLNELEWMGKTLLANIWLSDLVAAIDPHTGMVTAWIDLSPLRGKLSKDSGAANGIAFESDDAATDRLYVTGKNWNRMFQIEITPPLGHLGTASPKQ